MDWRGLTRRLAAYIEKAVATPSPLWEALEEHIRREVTEHQAAAPPAPPAQLTPPVRSVDHDTETTRKVVPTRGGAMPLGRIVDLTPPAARAAAAAAELAPSGASASH